MQSAIQDATDDSSPVDKTLIQRRIAPTVLVLSYTTESTGAS